MPNALFKRKALPSTSYTRQPVICRYKIFFINVAPVLYIQTLLTMFTNARRDLQI